LSVHDALVAACPQLFYTFSVDRHIPADHLLRRIEADQIDPSFVITHTASLEDGPEMYRVFRDKQDGCVKVVLKP
jgi:threonine dehydrogenase-like Zn-dependent dehydrogenase